MRQIDNRTYSKRKQQLTWTKLSNFVSFNIWRGSHDERPPLLSTGGATVGSSSKVPSSMTRFTDGSTSRSEFRHEKSSQRPSVGFLRSPLVRPSFFSW